jgi:uncharacterized protein YcbX
VSQVIATITHLYIYPIKSMAGISVQEAHVGLDGILGDRIYAFVRGDRAATSGFPWLTAREDARMLFYKPVFTTPPHPSQPEPPVHIETPEGAQCAPDDPSLNAALAKRYGHAVILLKNSRGIFDCQHISLFSLPSVRALSAESGVELDHRRFRANIYLEPASGTAFAEEQWTDCMFQIGSEALCGVTQRDTRCMMVNLDLGTGRQDPRVLKTVALSHQGQAGLYANVVRPGLIRVGDTVRRLPRPS